MDLSEKKPVSAISGGASKSARSAFDPEIRKNWTSSQGREEKAAMGQVWKPMTDVSRWPMPSAGT
jgi:hypothetical protein